MSNLHLVRGLYESFARGDLAGVLAQFDPQIVWLEAAGFPSVGGRHIGHQGVQTALTRVAEDWENLTVTPREYVGDGELIVVLGETSGTFRKTGRSFKSPFAHTLRLRDGKVIEWQAYIDTALANAATL